MKKQHLFTLNVDLVKRMHREVARGFRSNFVERAIKKQLDAEDAFDLEDVDVLDILAELTYRRELPEWFRSQVMLVRKEVDPEMMR
jgi:hypothetical protein